MDEILTYLQEQIGNKFELCGYFTGVRTFNDKPYFNIVTKERVSESQLYDQLLRLSKLHKKIEVQPNGVNRIAIIF
jgi:hypothetical protein